MPRRNTSTQPYSHLAMGRKEQYSLLGRQALTCETLMWCHHQVAKSYIYNIDQYTYYVWCLRYTRCGTVHYERLHNDAHPKDYPPLQQP